MADSQQAEARWFLGQYENAIDCQRRIAIPKAWRGADTEANDFFILPGRQRSLQLVPAPMFQEMLHKLQRVSFADTRAAIALATIGSMAQQCVCDRQGRIVLPVQLLQHAGLSDKAVLLGAVTTVQIWEPKVWQTTCMDSDSGLDVLQAIQEQPAGNFLDILRQGSSAGQI